MQRVTGLRQPDSDYASTSGTLSWASGDTANKTFSVPITNDTLDEPNETFTVTLTSPTGGATLGSPSSATVTIMDDDPTPTVQFSVASSSGSEATTPASITVTLSAASGQTVDSELCNGQRDGDGRERLHGDERNVDVQSRGDESDDQRADYQ